MIPIWVLVLALFFTVIASVAIALLVRLSANMEIIVRSITFGSPRVQERERRPVLQQQDSSTRPVGATAQHARG